MTKLIVVLEESVGNCISDLLDDTAYLRDRGLSVDVLKDETVDGTRSTTVSLETDLVWADAVGLATFVAAACYNYWNDAEVKSDVVIKSAEEMEV